MKLDIRYYGDPILREKAAHIDAVTDEIRQLADDMIETMLATNGIGLAAPQVGKLIRLFVSNVGYEDDKGELHLRPPRAILNPVLTLTSDTLVDCSEGCLSFPKLYLNVVRPYSVHMEAMDLDGNPISEDCYGYAARHMMHENDHLNGVLYIDRIKGKRRTEIEPQLRQIKMKFYKGK